MKQLKLSIPEAQAVAFAVFAFDKQIRIILSYSKSGDFFFNEDRVIVLLALTDEQAEDFKKTEFAKFATA